LGTYYGGDGVTTFALPDLQGRGPISMGNGAGLSAYNIGEKEGVETVTLSVSQLPSHAHGVEASATKAKLKTPVGAVPALTKADAYDAAPDGTSTMNAGMIAPTGGGEPVTNLPPFLVLNFCIALQGIFPSRG
jgi:microcystin-dependent protein